MADAISILRIGCGTALFFCPMFSDVFYILYGLGAVSDALDGFVARRFTGTTELGARLDTAADTVFFAAVIVKTLCAVSFPLWLVLWICGIAVIKCVNAVSSFTVFGRFVTEHTLLNKLTGAALFILPFTLGSVDIRYSAAPLCILATLAAVQEGRLIRSGRIIGQ